MCFLFNIIHVGRETLVITLGFIALLKFVKEKGT